MSNCSGRTRKPDGDFPNVPGHVANPENPAVFDSIIVRGREVGADVTLATDPDCDRIGCAAPLTFKPRAPSGTRSPATSFVRCWPTTCWRIARRRDSSRRSISSSTTLVTTQMVRRIGDSYGVETIDDLLVGFKWIAQAIDQYGPDLFVYGTEESHGYMAGSYVRDKDGAVASLLLCELAAKLKAAGQTVHEKLDALFWQHGVHAERTVSVQMPGSEGMTRMKEVMAEFRAGPPAEIGGMRVAQVRDYEKQTVTPVGGKPAAARRSEGRPGDSRSGDRGQLRGLPAQRHRAEDQVLHVHLHAARAAGELGSGQSGARSAARSHGSRPAEVRRRV